MPSFDFGNLTTEDLARNQAAFNDFSRRYRTDASYRREVDLHADAVLSGMGFALLPGTDVRIAVDTPQIMHVVMPPDPNIDLSDEALDQVAGGETVGSASTAGSISSLASSTIPSSAGTLGSASTAGSN